MATNGGHAFEYLEYRKVRAYLPVKKDAVDPGPPILMYATLYQCPCGVIQGNTDHKVFRRVLGLDLESLTLTTEDALSCPTIIAK